MTLFSDFFSRLTVSNSLTILLIAVALFYVIRRCFSSRSGRQQRQEFYTDEEKAGFLESARAAFGEKCIVAHDSGEFPAVHLDILVFPPSDRCPFYTFCTMGLGAHLMNVEKQDIEEMAKADISARSLMFPGWERSELLMYMPAEWGEQWQKEDVPDAVKVWPVITLKTYASLMVLSDTWHSFSMTVTQGKQAIRPGSDFVAFVLTSPLPDCRTPGFTLKAGEKDVSVLQMMPLTQEEYQNIQEFHPYQWVRYRLPEDRAEQQDYIAERLKQLL